MFYEDWKEMSRSSVIYFYSSFRNTLIYLDDCGDDLHLFVHEDVDDGVDHGARFG